MSIQVSNSNLTELALHFGQAYPYMEDGQVIIYDINNEIMHMEPFVYINRLRSFLPSIKFDMRSLLTSRKYSSIKLNNK